MTWSKSRDEKELREEGTWENLAAFPVKQVVTGPVSPTNSLNLQGCGVLNREGIYYALLRMRGEDDPMLVALHGVQSEGEAHEAFKTLTKLRQVECGPAVLSAS